MTEGDFESGGDGGPEQHCGSPIKIGFFLILHYSERQKH